MEKYFKYKFFMKNTIFAYQFAAGLCLIFVVAGFFKNKFKGYGK